MKTMRELINLAESVFGTNVTQEAKLTAYESKKEDKEKSEEETDESASGGATGAGAVATSAAPMGRKKGILRRK